MLGALPGEHARVFVEGARQVGVGERYVLGETFGEGVERAVGRAGLGEPIRGQQQRRTGWEGEPVDGRGFGGEFGETERDAGAEKPA